MNESKLHQYGELYKNDYDSTCAAIEALREIREVWAGDLERELAAAIAQRDKAVSRYKYVKKHFDEIYQLPIWTNDGNPDYRIDSDKFDAAIDAAMKEGG